MSDEELMKLAFSEDKTVADILRHIFYLGVKKGRVNAIDDFFKKIKAKGLYIIDIKVIEQIAEELKNEWQK